jgi:hypothetical protein
MGWKIWSRFVPILWSSKSSPELQVGQIGPTKGINEHISCLTFPVFTGQLEDVR